MATFYRRHFIILHWLMFVLIVAAYATIEFRGIFEKGTAERELIKTIHYFCGLSVFCLLVGRILSKLMFAQPLAIVKSRFQKVASRAVFFCLYFFMFSMPILGWLLVSAEGHSIQIWGMTLPALVAENHALTESIEEIHETLGKVGYALISIHVIAALFHHYVWKDDALTRIIRLKRN